MTLITDDDDLCVFHHPMPAFVRIVIGIGACFTFLAPWELLLRPGLHPFHLGMLPFWIISLGALSIGLPLLAAAIVGATRTLTFDFRRRRLIEVLDSRTFGLTWTRDFGFAEIAAIAVEKNTFTDGPDEWDVFVRVRDRKRPLAVAKRSSEEAADALARRLGDRMGRPTREAGT